MWTRWVLIESDWNLKHFSYTVFWARFIVLIESDWNLKNVSCSAFAISVMVLIESDWNLKQYTEEEFKKWQVSINRIRLEFKGSRLTSSFKYALQY